MSIAATAAVLVILGIGRAKIGRRRVMSTTLQTLCIAAAAGGAGVIVGNLFAQDLRPRGRDLRVPTA